MGVIAETSFLQTSSFYSRKLGNIKTKSAQNGRDFPLVCFRGKMIGYTETLKRERDTDWGLCSGWEFAERERGLSAGSGGAVCRLPHTIKETSLHYSGPQDYETVSGYRRRLAVDAAWKGKRLFLQFDGAAHIAEVFLNGEKCAEHRCGYTAFRVEITDLVNFGGENELAVRSTAPRTHRPALRLRHRLPDLRRSVPGGLAGRAGAGAISRISTSLRRAATGWRPSSPSRARPGRG